MTEKLWTKNFTIITVGTIISMLGNAIAGFGLAVLILELTDSSFAFALFLTLYNLPKLIVPMIAGTFLDRFSRVKVVYSLDFITAFVFLFIYIGLTKEFLNFTSFLILAMLLGSIDSIYSVAYDSLYPNYITKGNFSKAYSISSMIYPLAAFMTPVASFVYETIGLEVLFMFNAIAFLIASFFEMMLDKDESHISDEVKIFRFKDFKEDSKKGVAYIFNEKGLLTITLYFFLNSLFQMSATQTLEMPFFKSQPSLGYTLFTFVSTSNVLGRFIGGMIHYKFSFNHHKKFKIAMIVYIIICFTNGFMLYMPFELMLVLSFITGILSVTSFNIRISSTQAYVPDKVRGRFNGTFQMMSTTGIILGQLLWGALGEVYPAPRLILIGNMITLVLTFLVVYKRKESVKPIYNSNF
ncbi:MAG TPA: MFS transporter [Erysipelothrix sp.]|nr:MFS transporter [Erysipelothrix sp.]